MKTEYIKERVEKKSSSVIWAKWPESVQWGSRITILVKIGVDPKPISLIHRNGKDSWEIDFDRPIHRDAIDLIFEDDEQA